MVCTRASLGRGLVVDNIVVTGDLAYTENFEGALDPNVTLGEHRHATPFGEWARLYQHITDNDRCTENTTCAWLWTDPLRSRSSRTWRSVPARRSSTTGWTTSSWAPG